MVLMFGMSEQEYICVKDREEVIRALDAFILMVEWCKVSTN